MSTRSAFIAASVLAMASAVAFAAESPNLGRVATPEEIAAWDISIGPDGVGLPPGGGTPKQGEAVYAARCVACHGEKGAGEPNDQLVGGQGTLPGDKPPVKTVGSFWPYATTVFDYVRRAMPYNESNSLNNDEVYAVVAYQRHHRRQRHDGRADATKSENAEPRRIRDVFAREMNATC
jgi:S-disulfanyl-L-cysteine oxidoreductase SoxD